MNAKVSVVTPFYNSASYLVETIESVQSQIYEDWELILVDDGSSDNSVAIIEPYTKRDSRVVLVEYDVLGNKGKSYARNFGVERATGSFITFLDSDDIFLPNKLSVKLQIFQQYPNVDMVLGNTIYWRSWKKRHENLTDFYPDYHLDLNKFYKPGLLINAMLGSKGAVPCICSFIVKKNILQKVGLFNDGFTNLYEDQALITKLILESNIYLVDDYFEKYRQRDDSDWHQSVSSGEDEIIAKIYRKWLLSTLSNHPSVSMEMFALFVDQNPSLLNKIGKKLRNLI